MENISKGILVIIVGLIGGVAVGLQGPMSGTISARLGAVASSFIIHLGGVIASGVVLILVRGAKALFLWKCIKGTRKRGIT